MDLSDKFVDMCLKAKKIQEMWKPEEYDFVAVKYTHEGCSEEDEKIKIVNHIPTGVFDVKDMKIRVGKGYHWIAWIPRQDQLHDMLAKEYLESAGLTSIIHMVYQLSVDALYEDDGNTIRFHTIEQLMLACYMREIYDKYWYEDDWRERFEGY